MNVYVASSWRNEVQPEVVKCLRAAGHEVYDFRDADGFHWSQVDPEGGQGAGYEVGTSARKYLQMVRHPVAVKGFARDRDALVEADACVLVLPCGKSAHLEAGYMAGLGLPVIVLLEDPMQPELMYLLLHKAATSIEQVVEQLEGLA